MSEEKLTTRERVAAALDGHDPVLGRSVAFVLQGLIIISIVSLTVETMPDLPEWLRHFLHVEEQIILAVFTVEYVLRVWSAPRPVGYIFSFWGLIDLAAILPSLILAGTDLRSLRIFRMLRLLRLLKLMRYAKAMDRLRVAFHDVRDELILFLILSILVLYLCAAGIYFFEHDSQPDAFSSIPHSLWWAVATLTTVGYGDVYPVTSGGKLFTAIVLFIGLGIVAVPTGLVATALTRQPDPAELADGEAAAITESVETEDAAPPSDPPDKDPPENDSRGKDPP